MAPEDDYREVNRRNWDERVPAHAASTSYAVAAFAEDPEFLSRVVRFDLPRLGDIAGLEAVHLQCHIGTDTVSLARLGARMTGLDFSEPAIAVARDLAASAGADVTFVHADVYDAVDVLGAERFDLVYTGVGALCWLPSVTRWAKVVAGLLRPGGRLFIREGHPVLWAMDYRSDDGEIRLRFSYFEQDEPDVIDEPGTYVDTDQEFTEGVTHTWNRGLGEIVTALMDEGMRLTMLVEHDSAPWEGIEGGVMTPEDEHGERRLKDRPQRLPQTYTLQAVKDPF